MKNRMTELDELIKDTLTQEEAEFYNELDEQNAFEMLSGLYHGKNSWFIIVVNIVMLAALVAFIYCLVQFLGTEVVSDLIIWGAGGFVSLLIIIILKLFTWLQMDKYAILRELKRLELQISSLATKK